jgi:hypothetical protein
MVATNFHNRVWGRQIYTCLKGSRHKQISFLLIEPSSIVFIALSNGNVKNITIINWQEFTIFAKLLSSPPGELSCMFLFLKVHQQRLYTGKIIGVVMKATYPADIIQSEKCQKSLATLGNHEGHQSATSKQVFPILHHRSGFG